MGDRKLTPFDTFRCGCNKECNQCKEIENGKRPCEKPLNEWPNDVLCVLKGPCDDSELKELAELHGFEHGYHIERVGNDVVVWRSWKLAAVCAAMRYLAPWIEAKRYTWPGPTMYYPMRPIGQYHNKCPMNPSEIIANARWHVKNALEPEEALNWFQGACVAYYGDAHEDFAYSSKQARELGLAMVQMAEARFHGTT